MGKLREAGLMVETEGLWYWKNDGICWMRSTGFMGTTSSGTVRDKYGWGVRKVKKLYNTIPSYWTKENNG